MRKLTLLVALLLCVSLALAQDPVRFGRYQIEPEENVKRTRGKTERLDLGQATNGRLNVLVQFAHAPSPSQRNELAKMGIQLGDYVGALAYFATANENVKPSDLLQTGARSIIPIRAEWKINPLLYDGNVPDWARSGNSIKAEIQVFDNIPFEQAIERLNQMGYNVSASDKSMRYIALEIPSTHVIQMANIPWVQNVAPISPPKKAYNQDGSVLTKAANVVRPVSDGGRGLSGQGVKVGVWDGNLQNHVDLGNRFTRLEHERNTVRDGSHGMHVSGTIIGAGLLNPLARGIAPKAKLFTSNFGRQSNGLNEAVEMNIARRDYGISISSNSYGFYVGYLCEMKESASYSLFGAAFWSDLAA